MTFTENEEENNMNCCDGNSFRDLHLTNVPMELFSEHGFTEKDYNDCLTTAALFYQNDRNFMQLEPNQRRNFYA